eukprot:666972-Heterocapsa_arctica.AAC.1
MVAVPPPQERDGVREDLLGAHADEPLADALVLGADRRRRRGARIGVLPCALRTVLALHQVLGRARERQDAERLELQ